MRGAPSLGRGGVVQEGTSAAPCPHIVSAGRVRMNVEISYRAFPAIEESPRLSAASCPWLDAGAVPSPASHRLRSESLPWLHLDHTLILATPASRLLGTNVSLGTAASATTETTPRPSGVAGFGRAGQPRAAAVVAWRGVLSGGVWSFGGSGALAAPRACGEAVPRGRARTRLRAMRRRGSRGRRKFGGVRGPRGRGARRITGVHVTSRSRLPVCPLCCGSAFHTSPHRRGRRRVSTPALRTAPPRPGPPPLGLHTLLHPPRVALSDGEPHQSCCPGTNGLSPGRGTSLQRPAGPDSTPPRSAAATSTPAPHLSHGWLPGVNGVASARHPADGGASVAACVLLVPSSSVAAVCPGGPEA